MFGSKQTQEQPKNNDDSNQTSSLRANLWPIPSSIDFDPSRLAGGTCIAVHLTIIIYTIIMVLDYSKRRTQKQRWTKWTVPLAAFFLRNQFFHLSHLQTASGAPSQRYCPLHQRPRPKALNSLQSQCAAFLGIEVQQNCKTAWIFSSLDDPNVQETVANAMILNTQLALPSFFSLGLSGLQPHKTQKWASKSRLRFRSSRANFRNLLCIHIYIYIQYTTDIIIYRYTHI